ncbi:glycosyltransferase family 61 protein [Halorubrum ezzemoulense]|uniref:glycosyltransferase family 61 protein n=1 Tax=Halorubrum ezzemoulense TaxID=337243 RepID=UPI00232EB831|nr:glycosyltransferase family 61 protein [Halorubrum ezzemoulense]MDB2262452.1 glycosyltransferase family 61 protein [Halorubrum ezzemoulense]MDB2269231.1 glycosyltransferase family 61 protein [Halorubrum ezzemoulense]
MAKMRVKAQLDRAQTKLLDDGVRGVASRVVPFVLASGLSSTVKRRKSRESFLDISNLEQSDQCHSYFEIGSAHELTQRPPADTDENPFDNHTHHFDPAFVCEVKNVTLLTSDAIKLTPSGHVLAEEHYDAMGEARFYSMIYRHVRDRGASSLPSLLRTFLFDVSPDPKQTYEHAFPMVGFPMSFYHWVIEFLPRLRLFEAYSEQTGNRPTLLLPRDPPAYMTEYLHLLGYDEPDWDIFARDPTVVKKFVHPSHVRNEHGVPDPAACRWLRERVLDRLDQRDTTGLPKRLLISREDARERRLVNERDVAETLAQFGFERVVLSEYSIPEQIALFRQADCVISPHGAGLTNIIYGEDLTVLELFSNDFYSHYYTLSNVFGHEYHYYQGKSAHGVDVEIDLGWIERWVRSQFESQKHNP